MLESDELTEVWNERRERASDWARKRERERERERESEKERERENRCPSLVAGPLTTRNAMRWSLQSAWWWRGGGIPLQETYSDEKKKGGVEYAGFQRREKWCNNMRVNQESNFSNLNKIKLSCLHVYWLKSSREIWCQSVVDPRYWTVECVPKSSSLEWKSKTIMDEPWRVSPKRRKRKYS